MKPVTKYVIIGVSLALISLGGFLWYKQSNKSRLMDKGSGSEGDDASVETKPDLPTDPNEGRPNITQRQNNFNDVKKNLGLNISSKGNVVSVKFNGGKNQADFYNNDRVIISTVGKSGYLKKGSYSNGGKTIVIDGGKTITSGSVWGNLLNTLK
jgi:hypothetical protein